LRYWLRRALDRYPPLAPAPGGPLARVAIIVVALLAAAFAAFFIADQTLLHLAYRTHAEDLGIMDQALWTATHPQGNFFHQTICDIVGDTNCLGNIPRTAIHFEPILAFVGVVFAIIPSPLTLLTIQALVVASGAFPAYWIASRRLQSHLAGIAFAALYLSYPALQAAVAADFHAVTLSAALVLFALYFMVSRNNVGLWIACILAMMTKEEVPLLVLMIGLSIALLQRRWRLGLWLAGVAVAYLGLALLVLHLSSPLGHSPTAGRYSYLGATPLQAAKYVLTHPLQVIRNDLFSPDRVDYLRKLLAPSAYLALLSPLTLLIAVPELAINLLSSDPLMHSGISQYNADIVPVLLVAAIESVALLMSVAAWYVSILPADTREWLGSGVARARRSLPGWLARRVLAPLPRVVLAAVVAFALLLGYHEAHGRGQTLLTTGFHWPQVTAHAQLANSFLPLIPANASVSAQTDLVPHLSHRAQIYLFPDHARDADYVFLDVTSNIFPLQNTPVVYVSLVRSLLTSEDYHVVRAQNGYILLARGFGNGPTAYGDPYGLPASFYSFATTTPAAPAHPLAVQFGASLELVGYDISPVGTTNLEITPLTITTYWRVTAPVPTGVQPELEFFPPGGQPEAEDDLPAVQWLAPQRWTVGQTIAIATRPIAPVTGAGLLEFGARAQDVASGGTPPDLSATGSVTPAAGQAYPRLDAATGAVIFAGEQVIP
jgi:uncharacterized membrane protein